MLYFKYILLCIYVLLLIGLKNSTAQQVNTQQFGLSKNLNSTNVAIEQCWKLRKTNQKKAISYCNKALHDLRNNQTDRIILAIIILKIQTIFWQLKIFLNHTKFSINKIIRKALPTILLI